MHDEEKGLRILKEDRKIYLEKAVKYAKDFLEAGKDDLAATVICEAATGLKQVDGAIQYLEELQRDDDYPRFGTLF